MTISLDEQDKKNNESTKNLIISTLKKHPPITDKLTTNDKMLSILPLIQSKLNGLKVAHEYKLSLSQKDKAKKFKPTNSITITFEKRSKNKKDSFTYTMNVKIKEAEININTKLIPKSIDADRLFTTSNRWSKVLEYIQISLGNRSTSEDYTIKLKDRKSSSYLKETDHSFIIEIIPKKGKAKKIELSIRIKNIRKKNKKGGQTNSNSNSRLNILLNNSQQSKGRIKSGTSNSHNGKPSNSHNGKPSNSYNGKPSNTHNGKPSKSYNGKPSKSSGGNTKTIPKKKRKTKK